MDNISSVDLMESFRDNRLNYEIAMERGRQTVNLADKVFHSIENEGPHIVHVEWVNDIPSRSEIISLIDTPFLARGFKQYKVGYKCSISKVETWPMIWAAIKRRLKEDLGDRRGWLKNGPK